MFEIAISAVLTMITLLLMALGSYLHTIGVKVAQLETKVDLILSKFTSNRDTPRDLRRE